MSFFDKFKRAMGFPSVDDDEIEEDGIDATVTPLRERQQQQQAAACDAPAESAAASETAPGNAAAAAEASQAEEALRPQPEVIFSRVVEIFNEALPGFLQKSVDPEKQRQVLYSALDASIKNYFEELERTVERRHQARFQADRMRLQQQIDALKLKAQKEEEVNSDAKTRQLSAERQKRALSERVHDLEKRISEIEAENEQYILENKTMANKIRLLGMTDTEMEEMRRDTLSKSEELRNKQEEITAIISKAEEEVNSAVSRAAEAEKRAADAEQSKADADRRLGEAAADNKKLTDEISEVNRKLAALEAENRRMAEAMEQSKAKDELSMAMVNDLNSRAASARKDAEEKDNRIEVQKSQIQAQTRLLDEARGEIEHMKGEVADSVVRLQEAEAREQTASARLAKALDDLKIVKSVQDELTRLEEQQRVADARLRQTKDELMEKNELLAAREADIISKNTVLRAKDDTIRLLEDQSDRLRHSLETLQFEKSEQESALRQEIERMKALGRPVSAQPAARTETAAVPEGEAGGPAAAVEAAANDSKPAGETPERPAPAAPVTPAQHSGEDAKVEFTFEESLPEMVMEDAPAKPKARRGRPHKSRHPIPETPEEAAAIAAEEVADREGSLFPPVKKQASPVTETSADDDDDFMLLDTTDWLVPSETEEPKRRPKRSKKGHAAETADDNFGYREPARAEHPDNPAQMSLF